MTASSLSSTRTPEKGRLAASPRTLIGVANERFRSSMMLARARSWQTRRCWRLQPLFGMSSKASSASTLAAGVGANASANSASALGAGSIASGVASTATGSMSTASNVGAAAYGAGSLASGLNATAVGIQSAATGSSSVAIGDHAAASGAQAIAIGQGASANISVAVGGASTATQGSVAVGINTVATGVTSVAVGYNAVATGNDSIALGNGSVASDPDVVSVGSSGNNRRIEHVADGVNNTDAANYGQVQAAQAAAIATSNAYTDVRFNALNDRLTGVAHRADAATAAAMAIGGLAQAVTPGKSMVTGGVGEWNGQSAFAFGLSHRLDNHWTFKAGGAVTNYGTGGGTASVGYEF